MNPTFHSQTFNPDHPLHQITCFLIIWCPCDNKLHWKKYGV